MSPPWNLLKADLEGIYQAILADKPAVITVNAVIERAKANGLTALANEYACLQQQSNEVRLSQLLTAIEQHSAASSHVSRQPFDVFRHSIQGVCQYQPNYFAGDMTLFANRGDLPSACFTTRYDGILANLLSWADKPPHLARRSLYVPVGG